MQRDRDAGKLLPREEYERLHPDSVETIRSIHSEFEATDPPLTAPPPTEGMTDRISHYRLIEMIGRGGQGVVWRGEDTRFRRKVAIKLIPLTGGHEHGVSQRFEQEARIASKLDHPAICRVLDAGIEEQQAYMVMSFVEGKTLSALVAEARSVAMDSIVSIQLDRSLDAPIEEAAEDDSTSAASSVTRRRVLEILELFERISRALHHAHEHGVIHRDVKPGNIIVTPDGNPIVLDFGLARVEDDETMTRTGDLIGTPAYMAPEQITRGTIRIDRRADVYALGVTLFEALTLQRPYEAPTRESLYQAILSASPPDVRRLNPHVPKDLKIVLETALAKNREQRYATALDLAEELRRVREFQPILTRPPGPIIKLIRWAQRSPAVAGLTLVIICLLAGTAALMRAKAVDLAAANRNLISKSTEANEARDMASRALEEARLFSDRQEAAFVYGEIDKHWPSDTNAISNLQWWLDRAQGLSARREQHVNRLKDLESMALPYSDEDRLVDHGARQREIAKSEAEASHYAWMLTWDDTPTDLASQLREGILAARQRLAELRAEPPPPRATWRFSDPDLAREHANLKSLDTQLRELFDPQSGLVETMSMRLERARVLRRLTTENSRITTAWERAAERVSRNPIYRLPDIRDLPEPIARHFAPENGTLILRPQVGLLPLGPDPESGLEEFLHLESHDLDWEAPAVLIPTRSVVNGRHERPQVPMDAATGIILVLVPGGSFSMGSQRNEPSAANYWSDPSGNELPVVEVQLAPYFLSKYEMTQGQWRRASQLISGIEEGPSRFLRGDLAGLPEVSPRPVDDSHPVERVSWTTGRKVARALGLSLPTESQWERAARAGRSDTPWPGARTSDELLAYANLSDAPSATRDESTEEKTRDPWAYHAPVGRFRPNAFGFFDLSGNVSEWCRDRFAPMLSVRATGPDGLREGTGNLYAYRGGGFHMTPNEARTALRYRNSAFHRDQSIGLRPARPLHP